MEPQAQTLDQAIVTPYAGQPARLPAELRRRFESGWDGEPVMLYAFADLGPSLALIESWVALGASHVAVATLVAGAWEVSSFPLRRLTAVREGPGLSATTLTLLAEPGEPPLPGG